MVETNRKVPKPIPFDEMPPPEVPLYMRPQPPGQMRVTTVIRDDIEELAVIYKRTYIFTHNRLSQLADEQLPLFEEGSYHDEIAPGVPPSFKSLPEIIGYKNGTDLIVQANAQPLLPTKSMTVSVQVGSYRHTAKVIGQRFCDYLKGEIVFTTPKPFEEISLRYENAYGGRDSLFEEVFLKEVKKNALPDDIRQIKCVAETFLKDSPPVVYPRNRFGKGYVVENRRESIEGRELPNIERPDDLLTPARLVVDNPLTWNKQPLPVGFDYLDAASFPRSAMMGLPPPMAKQQEPVVEVGRQLIPEDYCLGNVFSTPASELPNVIHPLVGRCASLDLWLPFLRGNEEVLLSGMNRHIPEYLVRLPGEIPVFTINSLNYNSTKTDADLLLVSINLHLEVLTMIWSVRTPLKTSLTLAQLYELLPEIKVDMMR